MRVNPKILLKTIVKSNQLANLSYNADMQTIRINSIDFDNNGNGYLGYLLGNDECFENDDFYQWFFCTDGYIYKLFYLIPDDYNNDFGNIDYSRASYAIKYELRSDFDFGNDSFDFAFDINFVADVF